MISSLAVKTKTFLHGIGVDRAVAYTLLARGWPALSGVLTTVLLVRCLSLTQRGFYFTFSNILGLQIMFELGLSYVILQFASHERARLEWTPQGTLEGDVIAKSRLASLFRASILWYCVVAVLVVAVVLPIGFFLFSHNPDSVTVGQWRIPWFWIVTVSAGSVATSPVFALLEGCGMVAEVASVQAVQNVLRTFVLWGALWLHFGLFAAPLSAMSSLCWGIWWLWRYQRPFFYDLMHSIHAVAGIHWRSEVWPFQWKIAVSWLSGYFIFQLFNPMLIYFHRTQAAGQMGLSLSIMTAIGTVSLAWMTTKAAPFGKLIAMGNIEQLDSVFFRCLWQSLTVVATGGTAFWVIVNHLNSTGSKWGHAVLPPLPLGLLVAATVINHVVISEAIYLRAHKQEPFLWVALLTGLFTASLSFIFGEALGALGMMTVYFLTSLIVGLGAGTVIFVQKRRLWHAAPAPLVEVANPPADVLT